MRRDACRFLLILSYAGLKTAYAPYSTQRIYGRISKRPEILCHAMVLEGAYAGLYIGENSMEQFFQVGIITSAHGVHGEVKVYPTTDDAKRFRRLKEVIVRRNPAQEASGNHSASRTALKTSGISENTNVDTRENISEETLEIESVKFFKQFAILKFKGIDTMEAAEKYRKCSLIVPRSNAVRLSRDEYFIADLIGLTVQDEDGTEIGILNDVIETGANDVYAIRLHDGREFLLPAIKQCVLEVDVENGFIRIHILEGLLDEA